MSIILKYFPFINYFKRYKRSFLGKYVQLLYFPWNKPSLIAWACYQASNRLSPPMQSKASHAYRILQLVSQLWSHILKKSSQIKNLACETLCLLTCWSTRVRVLDKKMIYGKFLLFVPELMHFFQSSPWRFNFGLLVCQTKKSYIKELTYVKWNSWSMGGFYFFCPWTYAHFLIKPLNN